jgi:hypothetical protein
MLAPLNYSLIESNQLLTLGKGIKSLFIDYDKSNDPYLLYPFVLKVMNRFDEYSLAYERESKSPYTAKLLDSDRKRDSAFFGYRNYVEACSHSEDVSIQEAANRLLDVIEKHGWGAAYMGYKAETAALTKIINETKNLFMSDVDLIEATKWFNNIVLRETEFEEVQKSSATSQPSGLPTLVETRPRLIDAMRKLFSMVDNHATETTGDTKLALYLKAINEYITITMTTARAAETRDQNRKKNPEVGNKPVA